ncbi:MAG: NAD-dependent protein deacylase [Actinomycetia bacterium]|nr:NAD-dependent protein deacylase [Actinomycetes bacterium]
MTNAGELRDILAAGQRIVFFGGAGVSTASGIPDYRSKGGLYDTTDALSPERILSHSYFMDHTEEFYDFYRSNMLCLDAQPNEAHRAVAKLEADGKLGAVVTQNIDGLHQKAGSERVFELHGSAWRNYCMKCGAPYDVHDIAAGEGIPRCSCGGIIKPDVVLYEEQLDDATVAGAIAAIAQADVMIVGGTSLAVYPAAGMVHYFGGDDLVLINKSPTDYDRFATLVIRDPIDQVMGAATAS